jgi:Uma2 family endonuclease
MSPRTLHLNEFADRRLVLHGVSWEQYEALTDAIGDNPGVRTTYLEGELEIMSPGRQHEHVAKFLARLAEAYADRQELSFNGFKSETLLRKAKRVGAEPDECYRLGHATGMPDLAIEVVITSGGIDKLDAYRLLSIGEVWFWQDDRLAIYLLGSGGIYARGRRSRVLKGFPVARVERIVRDTDPAHQAEAVRGFRRSLGI